jgi:hypothetical protein
MRKTPDKETASDGARLRKMFVVGALVVLGLAGVLGGWSLYTSSAEREIRVLLERRAQALHDKDLSQYLSCFSPDYQSGTHTYSRLQADASRWFAQYATIQFIFHIGELYIKGEEAFVKESYTWSVTTSKDEEPLNISQWQVLEMRRENGKWKIFKTQTAQ